LTRSCMSPTRHRRRWTSLEPSPASRDVMSPWHARGMVSCHMQGPDVPLPPFLSSSDAGIPTSHRPRPCSRPAPQPTTRVAASQRSTHHRHGSVSVEV
jgi:hypothetical protein